MDYAEALAYLQSLTDYEKKTGYSYSPESFDLRRPRALLALLGNPQERFPTVVVAGTKGKGSTSAMVASILRAAGYRVGLYSQPHLHTFRERIRVDGELISRTELAGAIQETARAMETVPLPAPGAGQCPPATRWPRRRPCSTSRSSGPISSCWRWGWEAGWTP